MNKIIISITGLGYVGLPLALALSKHFKVIGFDINTDRIKMMQNNIDPSEELATEDFEDCNIQFTSDEKMLSEANFHIIGVPTDIDEHRVPNLVPLISASVSVGNVLKKGDVVVYESTVYPGCTEEDCLPVLEKASGLKAGVDFFYGYSPERIVPGDKNRPLSKILKIISACDSDTLDALEEVYGSIIEAGLYKASSVKVAEAAKVIENTQRDINISLMNELSIIFDKMDIDTKEVIEAAGSKWNFHKYYPGLVGGHCIGVDPYYLMHKAKQLGHYPQVIAAGRRINDRMPAFVAKKLTQTLIEKGKNPGSCKVLVMGITFKENVSDIRNSKVVDLVKELKDYSINVQTIDPYASPNELANEYGLSLIDEPIGKYDAIVLAVAHQEYRSYSLSQFRGISEDPFVLFDLKGIHDRSTADVYWTL